MRLRHLLPLALLPLSAPAAEMTLVVERSPDAIEVFFGLPATGLLDVFDLPPEALADATGKVAFEPLRQGTWLIGDAVIAATQTQVGGEPTPFEAMSLMVHPADQRLPLYDAMDGYTAIAVCAVDPPEDPALDKLYAYVGYIAYPKDPMAALSFALPRTGRGALSVQVRDFQGGTLLQQSRLTVADGGRVTLAGVAAPVARPGRLWLALAAAVLAGAGALAALRWRHDGPPRPSSWS